MRDRTWYLGAVTILGLATLTRFWALSAYAPTHDEMYTITLTSLTQANRIAMTVNDVHPPFYYELQAAWNGMMRSLLGRPPGLKSMRLFPALLGILSVAILLVGLRRLAGRSQALWAAAFWAVNPLAIGFAQTLRSYALATVFLFGCLVACPGASLSTSLNRRRWAGLALVVCGLGLLYSHILGVLILGAIGAVWFCERGLRPDRLRFKTWWPGIAVFGSIALGFLPWVRHLAHQMTVYQGLNQQHVIWASFTDFYLYPLYHLPLGWPAVSPSLRLFSILLVAFCLGIALVIRFRGRGACGGGVPAAAEWLLPRVFVVLVLFFFATWWPSWRKSMLLFWPAQVLLAALTVVVYGLLLANAGQRTRLGRAAAWILFGTMFASSWLRPLIPQASSYLWTQWSHGLPAPLRLVADGDPARGQPPAPRIVYPDFWAGLIPPDRLAGGLIPFSRWIKDPHSLTQEAILIEMMPHMRGYTAGETGKLEFLLVAARQASGYPPAVFHDLGTLDANTSLLRPFDARKFEAQYGQVLKAQPESPTLLTCLRRVTAPEMPQAPQGFYSLEHDDAFRFWRWTQGSPCHLFIPGVFHAGAYELLLAMDRPQPFPRPVVKWPWRVLDASGQPLAQGELDFSWGSPRLFRLPLRLDHPVDQIDLEIHPEPWQPTAFIAGTNDLRLLGARFFWAGVVALK